MKNIVYQRLSAAFHEAGYVVSEPARVAPTSNEIVGFWVENLFGTKTYIDGSTTMETLSELLSPSDAEVLGDDELQNIAVTRVSQLSGERRTQILTMRPADYQAWLDGKLIQNALPYLTADEREFLMTGISCDEWEEVFGERPAEEGTRNGA